MVDQKIKHLYVHIPFCPTKCSYCAFVTHVGSLRLVQPYVDALCAEIRQHASHERAGLLETVYFGGGTPSMLDPKQLNQILQTVDRSMGIANGADVTIEGHPLTVDFDKLVAFRRAGANRISFGVETLNSRELLAVGRDYRLEQVGEVLLESRAAGFENVAVDLMYGLPQQTLDSWSETLAVMLDLDVDHFSLYPLQIEPRTVFGRRMSEGTLSVPDDERVTDMYALACELLQVAGFEHYEFSNWSRPQHACRHNRAYWLNREYFAAGVGAHGYVKPWRTENIRGVKRYTETIAGGQTPVVQRELIDADTERRERVMLGLRLLQEGVDVGSTQWSNPTSDRSSRAAGGAAGDGPQLAQLQKLKLLRIEDGRAFIPEAAVPLANEVIAELI